MRSSLNIKNNQRDDFRTKCADLAYNGFEEYQYDEIPAVLFFGGIRKLTKFEKKFTLNSKIL